MEATPSISKEVTDIPKEDDKEKNLDEVILSLDSVEENKLIAPVEMAANEKIQPLESFSNIMLSISDDEIAALNIEDKYKLETELLQFMLRVRNIKHTEVEQS